MPKTCDLAMKCPSCAMPLAEPLPRCPHCKFSLQKLDLKFGLVPAHSRFLSDRTGTLSLAAMRELRASLRLFHTKFPQSLFSVFVTELAAGSAVGEFAFWMANRARFTSVDRTQGDNFSLLLVIDLKGNAAALTIGYGLERHVPTSALQAALEELSTAINNGDLPGGIRACINSLTRQLREFALKKTSLEETRARDSW